MKETLKQELGELMEQKACKMITGESDAYLDATIQLKLSQLIEEIATKGVVNFWIIFERMRYERIIVPGFEFNMEGEFVDVRIQDTFKDYEEGMKEFLSTEPLLNKRTLETALAKDKAFVKRHKPFFGQQQRWAYRFDISLLPIQIN